MKSYRIVAIIILVACLGAALIVLASKRNRSFNPQITLRKNDKVPYGYFVLHNLLPKIFANARFTYSKEAPASVGTLSNGRTAFFFSGKYVDPSDEELTAIAALAAKGNDVFFVCHNPSSELEHFFGVNTVYDNLSERNFETEDSPKVQLQTPVFSVQNFTYPGDAYYSALNIKSPAKVVPLGRINNKIYFVGGAVGTGRAFLHTAPLLFSNYFLLYQNNAAYLSALSGLVSRDVEEIVWSDYYLLNSNRYNYKEPSWLGVLWKYEAFQWGLGLLAAAVLLYLLINSQRKERPVPVAQPVRNDSLEYVSTIGGLYYHQGDHANLAAKMRQHLIEYLRHRYFIDLNAAGVDGATIISEKTGYPLAEAQDLLYHLNANQPPAPVDNEDVQQLYNLLQKFYKHNL